MQWTSLIPAIAAVLVALAAFLRGEATRRLTGVTSRRRWERKAAKRGKQRARSIARNNQWAGKDKST